MTEKKPKTHFGPKMSWRYVMWIAAVMLGIALIKYLTWITLRQANVIR